MDYSENKPIWPGSSSFTTGSTPFGFFDSDAMFQQHADSFAKYAAQQSIKSPNHVNNKRLVCPHCSKEGGYTAMSRWHMDNCKMKK